MSWYTGLLQGEFCTWYSHKVIGQGAYGSQMHFTAYSLKPLGLIIRKSN